jgi:hypothetical protein
LITFTKTDFNKRLLFYQYNYQRFLVLQVGPRIYQVNQVEEQEFIKTQRDNRQLNTGSAASLI